MVTKVASELLNSRMRIIPLRLLWKPLRTVDVAASEFFDAKTKNYNLSQKLGTTDRVMTPDALLDLYENLTKNYPIKSIEDPFD